MTRLQQNIINGLRDAIDTKPMTPTEINLNLDQARRKIALIIQEHINPIEAHYTESAKLFDLSRVEQITLLLDKSMDEIERLRQ